MLLFCVTPLTACTTIQGMIDDKPDSAYECAPVPPEPQPIGGIVMQSQIAYYLIDLHGALYDCKSKLAALNPRSKSPRFVGSDKGVEKAPLGEAGL